LRVLNFQRMSTEDGPGLRTTLFVKGCPLSCKWCHNPESIEIHPEIEWLDARCMGCGSCAAVCPSGALEQSDKGVFIDREKCLLCFACVDACPTVALERKGVDMDTDEIFAELVKDRAYFGEDGGVTLSGGEIALQYEAAAEILRKLKETGIHTAIDSCGLCSRDALDLMLPYTDLVLFDLKLADSERHKYWTGASNAKIIENFEYLCSLRQGERADLELWVRTPIIPGATDDDENIADIARLVRDRADRWELCAFNNLCRDKYRRLGRDWEFNKSALMSKGRMNELARLAELNGGKNVLWTGATALEEEK
jgi:pyruvate formate lyase activating enzyme